MDKLKTLYKKYEEIIIYLVVGVLTTIVSWAACFFAKLFLDSDNDIQNFIINSIGWVAGVLFAYPLNRIWVFKSTNKNIPKEFLGFATSRVSTWILDIVIMWLFVNILPLTPILEKVLALVSYTPDAATLATINYWFVKIFISAVLVTILNYVFSKVLIFGKKKNKDNPTE